MQIEIDDEEENENDFKQVAIAAGGSYRETFAARAVSDGIRGGHFEAAFLQVVTVIKHGTANELASTVAAGALVDF